MEYMTIEFIGGVADGKVLSIPHDSDVWRIPQKRKLHYFKPSKRAVPRMQSVKEDVYVRHEGVMILSNPITP